MAFPPNFTNIWDTTFPADTELANLLGANLRQLRVDVMQRLSLLSGTLANRPTPEILNATWGGAGFGLLYFSTDTNQVFQWNGVAWIDVTTSVGGGAKLVNVTNVIGINSAVGSTIFYAVPTGGIYRITAATLLTTGGTGGSINFSIGWNNGIVFNTFNPFGFNLVSSAAGAENFNTNSASFYAINGTNLTYAVAFAGVTGAPVCSLRIRVEFLS